MRTLTFFTLALAIPLTALAGPKEAITFGDLQLVHAFSGGKSVPTHEWVDEGATLESWDHLLAYREYPKEKRAVLVVRKYLQQTQPPGVQIFQKDGNPEDLTILFMLDAPDGSYTEVNIHRFTKEGGTVRSYQFASRNFQRELSELTDEIEKSRNAWLEEIGTLSAGDFVD